jgi:hypothetical protein
MQHLPRTCGAQDSIPNTQTGTIIITSIVNITSHFMKMKILSIVNISYMPSSGKFMAHRVETDEKLYAFSSFVSCGSCSRQNFYERTDIPRKGEI